MTNYSVFNPIRAVASVVSDLEFLVRPRLWSSSTLINHIAAWQVQEARLPFYSYVILNSVLRCGERILVKWTCGKDVVVGFSPRPGALLSSITLVLKILYRVQE